MNYGIEITKPWSKEMYDNNDMVSQLMKLEIIKSIVNFQNDFDKLNELMVLCGGIKYGDSYDIEELKEDCLNEVDNVQNYWLNEELTAVREFPINEVTLPDQAQ